VNKVENANLFCVILLERAYIKVTRIHQNIFKRKILTIKKYFCSEISKIGNIKTSPIPPS